MTKSGTRPRRLALRLVGMVTYAVEIAPYSASKFTVLGSLMLTMAASSWKRRRMRSSMSP